MHRPSDRSYPSRLALIEYPSSYPRRKVADRGEIYWRGARIFVSEVLQGEPLGIGAIDDGLYRVWFCSLQLGCFDERRKRLAALSRRRDNGPYGPPAPPVPRNSEPTLTKPTKGDSLFTMSPA